MKTLLSAFGLVVAGASLGTASGLTLLLCLPVFGIVEAAGHILDESLAQAIVWIAHGLPALALGLALGARSARPQLVRRIALLALGFVICIPYQAWLWADPAQAGIPMPPEWVMQEYAAILVPATITACAQTITLISGAWIGGLRGRTLHVSERV